MATESLEPARTGEPVVVLVEQLVGRWAVGDAVGVSRLFAEPVQWWTTPVPGAPWPAHVRTRREVEAFFIAFRGALEPGGITSQGLVVDRSDAVLMGRLDLRTPAGGCPVNQHFALSIGVRDGLISDFHLYLDTFAIRLALPR
ncbi:nuclear transport factor 2 family protein [Saccharothrix syringae]|uniref:SnoaL-like domain-containing protein n=1 Tax=Saccharothrix syringae TaxID=103733 RepID=A0A5Q0H1W9_SACSY|nr:nuclear transport factor 2 family protein [Saccharothrix syringae]QFZ20241.1 hypothetical protein EKG83_25025 [Saccharothrix syringae]